MPFPCIAKFVSFAAVLAAILFSMTAQAADAHSLLAASRQRLQTADYRASGHLVLVDTNGTRTNYPITIKAHWFPGVLRVYMELANAPKTGPDSLVIVRTITRILLEMRPGGKNTILVAQTNDKAALPLPFDKWSEGLMGTTFSYEDFLEAQYFWTEQATLGEKKFGARECDVVKSTPSPADRSHYAEVTTWLDHGIGFPVYVEKKLKGGTVKEFTYIGLRQEGGIWSAHQVEAKIHGQSGSTLLIIDRGTPKANLSMKDFSPAQLTHF
jgi:hypothetical protein